MTGGTGASDAMSARLGNAAACAATNAHAPYSRFRVGAAALAEDGSIFVGCNIENVSFPEGICAETAAIAALITAGRHQIVRIAIWSTGPDICTPCGGCRQRIAEFGSPSTIIEVFCDDVLALRTTLAKLLPSCFGSASIDANRNADAATPEKEKI